MQLNRVGERRLFKLFGHFNLLLLILGVSLNAQSFKEFKKTQTESFQHYQDQRDKIFNKYLKEQWQEYKAQAGVLLYEEPKPKNLPRLREKEFEKVGPSVHIKLKKILEESPKKENSLSEKGLHLNFFGSSLYFSIDDNIKEIRYFPRNQIGITNYFNSIAQADYKTILNELKQTQNDLALNDWGIYLLVKNLAEKSFSNEDEARLFTWFILNKLSYNVKIGLSGRKVVLMHYSEKTIYATPNYIFNGKKFYVLAQYAKGKLQRVYTYAQDYPNATKPINLALKKLPNLKKDLKQKELSFEEFGKIYKVSFPYNQNIIDFMATYPQADYETYFNAPMEKDVYYSIAKGLKKYIDDKHMSDGINFVLHFVQKSFVYELDKLQFGREKVMFAEETLYYHKSDCEDRAILFAYLINHLFHISVIGVKYSDHMTTALYVPIEGDSVNDGGRRYVIADPTYVNASLGENMPRYKLMKPQNFIRVENR